MPKKLIILLLEDTQTLLDIYKTRFIAEGYEVFAATNGENAVELANIWNPELFIVDLMLPDMDGLQFIKKIKESSVNNDSSFFILTALDAEEMRRRAAVLGVDAYLIKSQTNLEEIVNKAKAIIKKKSVSKDSFNA
jgi:DNA-binding response OmpR family regulator